MTNTYGVSGTTTMNYAMTAGMDAGITTLSPDSLLAYCQIQLGDLDGQITTQMNAQKTALREREAVQSAQSVLGQFGTAGPANATDMQTCVTALDNAAAQLPADDPVRAQLADFRAQMCVQYDFTPARPLTQAEQSELTIIPDFQTPVSVGDRPNASPAQSQAQSQQSQLESQAQSQAQARIDTLHQLETTGVLGKVPDKDTKEWQGTTDALANITDDIKSNAEIQMLQLQDLVSQRQQAVQLASGIMGKEDQTLESQAKAIGQ
jgi:hypothetical protein